jgi:pimeloyl-ACP methyl ester carboxylesterase
MRAHCARRRTPREILLFLTVSALAAAAAQPEPWRPEAAAIEAPKAASGTVRSKDGTLISYLRMGQGPPLVLVHGATSDHTRFAPVLDAFSTRFTVYAMDRRGRGGSGDSADYSPEREYEDVAAVVAAAGQPVFLLGHSFGGICAMEAALRFGGVRKLILYEPPVAAPNAGRAAAYETMLRAGQDEEMLESFLRENARLPDHEIEALRRLSTWPARVTAARTVPREMRVVEGYRVDAARLATLGVPTLLLLGSDSQRFQHEGTESLHKAILGSRVVVMSGQQHSAMMTAPQVFAREVGVFLEE